MVVLAGPLGAGKTTVLNHVLRHSADTRVGVIVNDFGAIDVDGLLVAGQADLSFTATGGCLCCASDDGAIADLLARLSAPRAGIDAIIVEASGVADPVQLVQRVVDDLGTRARFGGLVVLLDAEHTTLEDLDGLGAGGASDGVRRGIEAADLVVITKADRVEEGHRARLRAALRTGIPGRPVTTAVHGALDPSLLFDLRHEPERQLTLADIHAGAHTHLHAPYRSVNWTSEQPLHPQRVARLLADELPEAFRIKGFLRLAVPGYPARWTVQRVGRHVRLTPGVPADLGRRSELVLIGPDLGPDAYDALDAVVQRDHEAPRADDLWGFERLVPTSLRPPLPGDAGSGDPA